jgi:tripartite-type tricarboxylate transporter receptor subunit TctC
MRLAAVQGALALAVMAWPGNLSAQTFPERPIHLIVPSAPGGPTDVPARLLSQFLPDKLGQPAVVENRAGAGGAIGARFVAGATPDGYTLLVGNTSVFAVWPSVSPSAGYDPAKSFAPVAKLTESYQILVVPASSPLKTVREFVDFAKKNPGKLNVAHTGTGGLPHMTVELLKVRAGIDVVGVPYKSGGESVTAVLAAQVDATIEGITILLPHIRAGKLRALAVTSRERTPLAPELPTMIEAGVPDYEMIGWNGFFFSKGIAPDIVARLQAELAKALAKPEVKQQLVTLGAEGVGDSPQAFAAFFKNETVRWGKLIKDLGIKPE